MNKSKSKLLTTNIINLVKNNTWSIDFGEYQALCWNEKGILAEGDYNIVIDMLEPMRNREE